MKSCAKCLCASLCVVVVAGAVVETPSADLKVRISPGTPFVLSWSTNIPSFGVETSTNPVSRTNWQRYGAAPGIFDANYVITNELTDSSRMFRLSNWPQRACYTNLLKVGVALKTWCLDNGNRYPWAIPFVQGGTQGDIQPGPDGFDLNSYLHFQVMSNQLNTPMFLVCPGDLSKMVASNFWSLGPGNVTYELPTTNGASEGFPGEIVAVCPVDGNTLYADGKVVMGTNYLAK